MYACWVSTMGHIMRNEYIIRLICVNNRINNRIYRRCEGCQLEVDRADELGERQGQQPLQHRLPGQGWMVVVVE